MNLQKSDLGTVEDLMKVYQGMADKNTVFEQYKHRYVTFFDQNKQLEVQRQRLADTIMHQGNNFRSLVQSQQQDQN